MENQTIQSFVPAAEKIVSGPKALFWYLTLFFTLGITAFSTGGLWFQFINKWFYRQIQYGQVVESFSQTALKMQIASLLIAVPLYFVFSLLVRKALKKNELAANNKVRLWITYIILFLMVATAAGDLITATFYLLNGDYTTRFLLKCLAILIIVIWVFVYYWLELRSPKTLTDSMLPRIMGGISLAVIIISFITAFFIVESPAESRKKAFDRTRVNNLQEIKYAVDDYYREYKKLPATLDDLRTARGYIKITDPQTGQPFGYEIKENDSYKLCADFEVSNKNQPEDYYYPQEFLHEAGHICFDRSVSQSDKEIKPIDEPTVAPENN